MIWNDAEILKVQALFLKKVPYMRKQFILYAKCSLRWLDIVILTNTLNKNNVHQI